MTNPLTDIKCLQAKVCALQAELANVTALATTSYANNAAALAAGLTVGQLYRNGDVVQVVHA